MGRTGHRIAAIDWARGVAVLLMIAVHTTDVLLAREFRSGDLWTTIHILFGFVAPAFIVYAGVTLYAAVDRRNRTGSGYRDIVRRYAWILWLGVWLHIPHHSYSGVIARIDAGYTGLLDIDVLHLIGLSGLPCLALLRLVSSRSIRNGLLVVTGILLVIATPALSHANASHILVQKLFTTDSPFPFTPNAAYFLFGFLCAPLVVKEHGSRHPFATLVVIGVGAIALGLIGPSTLGLTVVTSDFWSPGLFHFLFRSGGVVLLLVLLLGAEKVLGRVSHKSGPDILARLGRWSLGIYVIHLMIVYGSPVTMGLADWYGGLLAGTMNPMETAMVFTAVVVATSVMVGTWKWVETTSPDMSRKLAYAWWLGFWIVFFGADLL